MLNDSRSNSWRRNSPVVPGIQGHVIYIDEDGDAEANYTVVALISDDDEYPTDDVYSRSLQPVGHFEKHGDDIPVSFNLFHQNLRMILLLQHGHRATTCPKINRRGCSRLTIAVHLMELEIF